MTRASRRHRAVMKDGSPSASSALFGGGADLAVAPRRRRRVFLCIVRRGRRLQRLDFNTQEPTRRRSASGCCRSIAEGLGRSWHAWARLRTRPRLSTNRGRYRRATRCVELPVEHRRAGAHLQSEHALRAAAMTTRERTRTRRREPETGPLDGRRRASCDASAGTWRRASPTASSRSARSASGGRAAARHRRRRRAGLPGAGTIAARARSSSSSALALRRRRRGARIRARASSACRSPATGSWNGRATSSPGRSAWPAAPCWRRSSS